MKETRRAEVRKEYEMSREKKKMREETKWEETAQEEKRGKNSEEFEKRWAKKLIKQKTK